MRGSGKPSPGGTEASETSDAGGSESSAVRPWRPKKGSSRRSRSSRAGSVAASEQGDKEQQQQLLDVAVPAGVTELVTEGGALRAEELGDGRVAVSGDQLRSLLAISKIQGRDLGEELKQGAHEAGSSPQAATEGTAAALERLASGAELSFSTPVDPRVAGAAGLATPDMGTGVGGAGGSGGGGGGGAALQGRQQQEGSGGAPGTGTGAPLQPWEGHLSGADSSGVNLSLTLEQIAADDSGLALDGSSAAAWDHSGDFSGLSLGGTGATPTLPPGAAAAGAAALGSSGGGAAAMAAAASNPGHWVLVPEGVDLDKLLDGSAGVLGSQQEGGAAGDHLGSDAPMMLAKALGQMAQGLEGETLESLAAREKADKQLKVQQGRLFFPRSVAAAPSCSRQRFLIAFLPYSHAQSCSFLMCSSAESLSSPSSSPPPPPQHLQLL